MFINLALWPPSRSGEEGGRTKGEARTHWKGESDWKHGGPSFELLPMLSHPWVSWTAEQGGYVGGHESGLLWAGHIGVLHLSSCVLNGEGNSAYS